MKMKRLLVLMMTAVVLAACERAPSPVNTTALWFIEQEPRTEPYRTRMLVTDDYLRIDDGEGTGDFVLYARRERAIYNVTSGDRLVLVIREAAAGAPPTLRHETVREKDEAPQVGGHAVVHYRLMTGGKVCHDLYAAAGLLPQAVEALREFISVLASDQAARLAGLPREVLTPCYLANNAYAATRYLDYGLPVRRADHDGRVSELVDYRTGFAVEAGLFRLPADYRRMEIAELRGKQ
jgi:hypothetical protein